MVGEKGTRMKCPACENDVPSGRSACTWCGAPLPAAGERPGPEPGSLFRPRNDPEPQAGPSNPKTEPLPVTDWEATGERPAPTPPEPRRTSYPVARPEPPRNAGPVPSSEPYGDLGPYGAPNPFGSPEPMPGAGPEAGPTPPVAEAATQNLGSLSPAAEAATQNLGSLRTAGPVTGGPMAEPAPYGYPPLAGEPGAPGEPAGPGDEHSGKSRKTLLLACGVAAVVVLGGGLVYALTQGLSGSKDDGAQASGTTSVPKTAAQQAAAVNKVLSSGKTARGHLPAPLRTCDDVAAGVAGFQQVVRDRQQELSQSKQLKVDRLRNGARLRRWMINAYQSSLDADQAYLAWAREVQSRGCGDRIAPLTAHYRAAIAANDKAGPAKRRVAGLWKPIANSQGLPTYAWNRL
jgi:hypothetical protein